MSAEPITERRADHGGACIAGRDYLTWLDQEHRCATVEYIGRVFRSLSSEEVSDVWSRVLLFAWRRAWNSDDFESTEHECRTVRRCAYTIARLMSKSTAKQRTRAVFFTDIADTDDALGEMLTAMNDRTHSVDASGQRTSLAAVLSSMTKRQREVLDLTVCAEQRPRDVADELGISQSAVCAIRKDALRVMRRKFEGDFVRRADRAAFVLDAGVPDGYRWEPAA